MAIVLTCLGLRLFVLWGLLVLVLCPLVIWSDYQWLILSPFLASGAACYVAIKKGRAFWGVTRILMFTPWWLYCAFELAKPGSWWYENVYDDTMRRRAIQRYGRPLEDRD